MASQFELMVPDAEPVLIVKEIIADEHKQFWHLKSADIAFVWVNPTMMSGAGTIFARVHRTPPTYMPLTKYDFVIEVSQPVWGILSGENKYAIMKHELKHCGVHLDRNGVPKTIDRTAIEFDFNALTYKPESAKLKYGIIKHDVEIFLSDLIEGLDLPSIDNIYAASKAGAQIRLEHQRKEKK